MPVACWPPRHATRLTLTRAVPISASERLFGSVELRARFCRLVCCNTISRIEYTVQQYLAASRTQNNNLPPAPSCPVVSSAYSCARVESYKQPTAARPVSCSLCLHSYSARRAAPRRLFAPGDVSRALRLASVATHFPRAFYLRTSPARRALQAKRLDSNRLPFRENRECLRVCVGERNSLQQG